MGFGQLSSQLRRDLRRASEDFLQIKIDGGIPALRRFTGSPTAGQSIQVHDVPSPGFYKNYRFDTSSTDPDDGLNVIKVPGVDFGRWVTITDPVVIADATTLDGNTPAFYLDADNHTDGATNKVFTALDETKLGGVEALADVTDATNVDAAGAVMETDFDAQTVLLAVADNVPLPVTIPASSFVGRKAAGDAGTMTGAEAIAVLGIETGATADQTDAEIETAYNNQVDVILQAEAEGGVATTVRRWTAERVAQAIAALASGGAGNPVAKTILQNNEATPYAALISDTFLICVSDVVGAFQIELEAAPTLSRRIEIMSGDQATGANEEVLILRNGNQINGTNFNYSLAGGFTSATLHFDGGSWWVVNTAGGGGTLV